MEQMDDEDPKAVQERIKAFLDLVKKSPDYITKTIYDEQTTLALDRNTGFIFTITYFKSEYSMDFMSKDEVDAIVELVGKHQMPGIK